MAKRVDETIPKRCTKCGEVKPPEQFERVHIRKDGTFSRNAKCKKCSRQYIQSWKRANRFAATLMECRTRSKQRGHKPCIATASEIAKVFTGRCIICGVDERNCSRKLNLDHDHKTGKFRGWLCGKCNTAIGLLNDSPELIFNVALYIENHNG